MLPYFVLLGFVVVAAGLGSLANSKARERVPVMAGGMAIEQPRAEEATGRQREPWNLGDVVACAALIAFAGVRVLVGTDYTLYENLFNHLQAGFYGTQVRDSPQEPGFTALQIWLHGFTDDPRALFLICAALTVIPAYIVIKRLSAWPVLSLVLYVALAYYIAPFNVMRQGIAVSLMLLAGSYLSRREWLRFALVSALAYTVHSSVVVIAAVYLVVWLAPAIRPRVTTVLGAVVLAFAASRYVLTIGPIADLLYRLNPRYDLYVDASADQSQVADAGIGTYLQIAVRVALLVLAAWSVRTNQDEFTIDERRWYTLVVIGTLGYILGIHSVVLARVEGYFTIWLVLLLPNVLRRNQNRGPVTGALVAASLLYLAFYVSRYADLSPYQGDWSVIWFA